MKRSSRPTFGTCEVHLGVCLALLANLLLPAFSVASPHQKPAPSNRRPKPDTGPFIRAPKTTEPRLIPEPPAPKGTGMTLLDRVGMLKQRLDPQQVAAWRRELEAPATSSSRKFQLRLWLAEARMRVDLEPDQARAEVESLLDDLPASSPLRGVATLDLGITQFATGRYRLAARTLADLLDTKIAGYDRNGAALLAKHANACAGYHEERRKAGITEPSHIDPLCGASGLAIALRHLGRAHGKAELASKTPHTGFGSNLQDLIAGAKNHLGILPQVDRSQLISKTEFVRGIDCERRLWFDRNRPELKPSLSEAIQERIEVGSQIGKLAQQRYLNGTPVLARGDYLEAARLTQELIESGAECIFEATFVVREHLVRVDVLSRGTSGWILDEVKSSSVKEPEKLDEDKVLDLAFQVYTLKQAGLTIERARLVLVDTSYVWDGSTYHPETMLGVVDLTEQCEQLLPKVEERSKALQDVLKAAALPDVELNTHCKKCDYFEACHEGRPFDVIHLPRMNEKSVRELRALGYDFIDQIPDSHKLTEPRRRMRDVVVSGKPFVGEGLGEALRAVQFPACFIDYESSNPAFPMIPGTRPYQQVCFQWSAHVMESPDSAPVHHEFLAPDASDPRGEFCRTLWEVVRHCRSIVYYTHFELTQIRAMERDGIPFAKELVAALEDRTVDLEKLVNAHLCYPEFVGRTSLKVVLPVLVPSMTYKDMRIADASAAAWGYRRMLTTEDPEEATALRAALLEYCCQDTLAMVEIYRALIELSDRG